MSRTTKYKNVKIFNCNCIDDDDHDTDEHNDDDVIIIVVYITRTFL